jgi:hypothetical protein
MVSQLASAFDIKSELLTRTAFLITDRITVSTAAVTEATRLAL